MSWVTLTTVEWEQVIYVNMAHAIAIYPVENDRSLIFCQGGSAELTKKGLRVIENPQEVVRRMREASDAYRT